MLPDPDSKAREELELEPVQATTMMTAKVVLCLVGCSKRSLTEIKLRETQRRSQPNSRRMITINRATQDVKVQEGTMEGKCFAGPLLTSIQE